MNADVVLVNPMDNTQLRRNLGLKAPPLNLLYLASFLEKRLRKVKILDDNLYGLGFEKIAKIVAGYNPLVVGITAVTATVKTTFCYIKAIKKLLPNALIVIGGPHATFMPEQTLMECAELDVVVRGEGEETLSEIVDTYEVKGLEGLGEVKGITYRKSGVIKENAARPFIENLDYLPFPARHLIPFEAYRVMGSPIGDMITSRGCPFFCGFCSSSRLMGKRYRRRSASNVVDEIEELVYKYKVRDIEFIDDIFTLDRKRVEEIVKAIKERKLDVNFTVSSRVDTIDLNLLRMLKNVGLSTIYCGAESGSDRVLRLMGKGITTWQTRLAVKKAKDTGVNVVASFILGYPGETLDEIEQTINFSISLPLDYAQFSILTPYPGTPIYHQLRGKGLLATEDWDKYTTLEPVIEYEKLGLSKRLVSRKLTDAYYRFYFRPSYLAKHIWMIKVLGTTLFRSYLLPKLTGGGARGWYRNIP